MSANRKPNFTLQPFDAAGFRLRLREAIKIGGQTQESLAAEVGVSLSGLRKWLSGATDPGLSGVAAAAAICGVSLDWLATGEGGPQGDRQPSENRINEPLLAETLRLIDDWLAVNRRTMTAARKAEIAASIYAMTLEDVAGGQPGPDRRRVAQILKLVE